MLCLLPLSSPIAFAKQVDIPLINEPPTIDGLLDDPAWQSAAVIDQLRQIIPIENGEPTEKTVVYLARDEDTLYFGFRLYQDDPSGIIKYVLKNDAKTFNPDDHIGLALDTLNDNNNAYNFAVNANGAKKDARFENSTTVRDEWDAIWYAKTNIDDKGWTAEIAIPAKSVSFSPESDTWGFDMLRFTGWNRELTSWNNSLQNKSMVDVETLGDLTGVKGLSQGHGLDIKPSVALKTERNEQTGHDDLELKPGLEMVYKLTPSLNGSLLLNPDFSDARVDDIQSNLTRFALLFPEQRDFFVRDADTFEFGGLSAVNGMPYFSRRIGLIGDSENPDRIDIDAGVKLSGRSGPFTVGVMNVQMDEAGAIDSQNLTVVRTTMDVMDNSRVGIIATEGDPLGRFDNSLAGADFRYRRGDLFGDQTFVVDAFYMQSDTEGVDGDDAAYGVRIDYPNDRWLAKANFIELQDNYNPALGFVNRLGIRQYDGQIRRRFRPNGNSRLRTVDFAFAWTTVTNLDNEIESNTLKANLLNIEGHDSGTLAFWWNYRREDVPADFEISQGVIVPQDDYVWHEAELTLSTIKSKPLYAELSLNGGDFYDGDKTDITGKLSWRASSHLLVELQHQHIDVELSTGEFDIEINRLLLEYVFSPQLSWSNYFPHETETSLITFNSQFRWEIEPGNELTLTLNRDMRKEDRTYITEYTDAAINLYWTLRF